MTLIYNTNTCPIKMPMQEENPDHSVNMADRDTLKSQKADKYM